MRKPRSKHYQRHYQVLSKILYGFPSLSFTPLQKTLFWTAPLEIKHPMIPPLPNLQTKMHIPPTTIKPTLKSIHWDFFFGRTTFSFSEHTKWPLLRLSTLWDFKRKVGPSLLFYWDYERKVGKGDPNEILARVRYAKKATTHFWKPTVDHAKKSTNSVVLKHHGNMVVSQIKTFNLDELRVFYLEASPDTKIEEIFF